MRIFSLASIVAIALLTSGQAAVADQVAQAQAMLKNAGRELDANATSIDAKTGLAQTLHLRVLAHLSQAAAGADPIEILKLAQLDASLIDQLATQNYITPSSARGPAEIVVTSQDAAKRATPLALYIPSSYAPGKPAPVIVYLHGKGQSEADVVASSIVEGLADDTGALIVAPFAGGDDMLVDASINDVYQALAATEAAFSVDKHRIYLAGHSLGGFAAFKALARRPDTWNAALIIEAAVAETDSDAVATHVKGKPIYIVAGTDDASIKAAYVRQLADWLRRNGALVTYYEQPGGTHSLASVAPIVTRAWRDMLAGTHPAAGASVDSVSGPTPVPTRESN